MNVKTRGENNHSIVINHAYLINAGTYQCISKNDYGYEVVSEAELIVLCELCNVVTFYIR